MFNYLYFGKGEDRLCNTVGRVIEGGFSLAVTSICAVMAIVSVNEGDIGSTVGFGTLAALFALNSAFSTYNHVDKALCCSSNSNYQNI